MFRPIVTPLLPVLLGLASAAAQAEPLGADQPPASAWYALLIVVFAAVVVIGLLSSRNDRNGDPADTRDSAQSRRHKKESLR